MIEHHDIEPWHLPHMHNCANDAGPQVIRRTLPYRPQRKETAVFVIFRLFRFYRRSGMTRTNAIAKAVATVKRDMQFKVGK